VTPRLKENLVAMAGAATNSATAGFFDGRFSDVLPLQIGFVILTVPYLLAEIHSCHGFMPTVHVPCDKAQGEQQ